MPENDKAGTEEESIILHCVKSGQKDGRKKSETFQKPPIKCINNSKASGLGTRLLKDLKNHGNRILIFFDEETFTTYPMFNKRNNQVATFGNDVFEHRRVSTANHSVLIMMLGADASNRKKMLPVWFERS